MNKKRILPLLLIGGILAFGLYSSNSQSLNSASVDWLYTDRSSERTTQTLPGGQNQITNNLEFGGDDYLLPFNQYTEHTTISGMFDFDIYNQPSDSQTFTDNLDVNDLGKDRYELSAETTYINFDQCFDSSITTSASTLDYIYQSSFDYEFMPEYTEESGSLSKIDNSETKTINNQGDSITIPLNFENPELRFSDQERDLMNQNITGGISMLHFLDDASEPITAFSSDEGSFNPDLNNLNSDDGLYEELKIHLGFSYNFYIEEPVNEIGPQSYFYVKYR